MGLRSDVCRGRLDARGALSGVLEALAESRERVVSRGDLVDGDAELERERISLHDVGRAAADDMDPENFSRLSLEDDFEESSCRIDVERTLNDGEGVRHTLHVG